MVEISLEDTCHRARDMTSEEFVRTIIKCVRRHSFASAWSFGLCFVQYRPYFLVLKHLSRISHPRHVNDWANMGKIKIEFTAKEQYYNMIGGVARGAKRDELLDFLCGLERKSHRYIFMKVDKRELSHTCTFSQKQEVGWRSYTSQEGE